MRTKVVLILVVVVVLAAQTPIDPYEGVLPHDIPSCSTTGKRGSARCSCIGMVSNIQRKHAEECWAASGVKIPPDAPVEIKDRLTRGKKTKAVEECLASTPDHCRIIATFASQDYAGCRTKCKPERCTCPDNGQICSAHGEGEY